MDKEVKLTMELDLKGNEKLDKLKASLSDVKESVENVTDTTHGLGESMRGLANIGMVFNSLNNAFDILKQGVSALATEFNSFDKGMRAVNTMAGLGEKELGRVLYLI